MRTAATVLMEDAGSRGVRNGGTSLLGSIVLALPPAGSARLRLSLGRKSDDYLDAQTPNLKSGSCETLSVHSTTSGAGGVTLRQPAKNRARNRYSKRFSQVFGRGGAGAGAGAGGQATPPPPPRGGSVAAEVGGRHTEDPTELSTQVTAPGVLKIFGGEISAGANYKSVLATPASSAQELVKEALERYGLERSLAGDYVLCEAVGRTTAGADGIGGGGGDGAAATGEASTGAPGGGEPWRAECLRAIADYEKPLLLQALWKPREDTRGGSSCGLVPRWRSRLASETP
ncbi:ras-associating and dilute domain-containing protein-like [Lethenteron reissneri]|uniref:ras-associating and dilute domain-containing protein-like n=1 Tax=Lethenteron reissneri TaxID=7753 RepID=UPI002AB68784|nr:ras-associating and dilute domain-containing protein-like [Lethenteron reissneri]